MFWIHSQSLFGDWLTGRVHSATVTSADDVKSTAMVEWYERKICRGKEVSGSYLETDLLGETAKLEWPLHLTSLAVQPFEVVIAVSRFR